MFLRPWYILHLTPCHTTIKRSLLLDYRRASSQMGKTIRVERGPGLASQSGGLQIGAGGEVGRRPARGATSPDASKALSPQQRLVARKLAQSAQREAELIRASSESVRARQVAKKRFLQEVQHSGTPQAQLSAGLVRDGSVESGQSFCTGD
jgi:hypothetical protein